MGAPTTYAQWLPLLDQFRAGDDSVLETLCGGSIEWTNVVAERWTRHVGDSVTTRLQSLSKQLQTSLDRARGDYFAISNALLHARRGLSPLRQFVALPALPPDVKNHLMAELDRWASETQKSLERHAQGVRHDQGGLLKTIRDHPLTAVVEVASYQRASPNSESGNPPVRGRRVIL
jgi:hypothetical protein